MPSHLTLLIGKVDVTKQYIPRDAYWLLSSEEEVAHHSTVCVCVCDEDDETSYLFTKTWRRHKDKSLANLSPPAWHQQPDRSLKTKTAEFVIYECV